jgi:uncharacterized membrane protein SirB2
MNYLLLKQIHASLALISISGFILRWCWRMMQSPLAQMRAVLIAPHVVDTLFLATAIALGIMADEGALSPAWFSAKIIGLVVYVLLGMVAMRAAPSLRRSLPAFIAAVGVFAWIATVARTKSPLGFVQYLLN